MIFKHFTKTSYKSKRKLPLVIIFLLFNIVATSQKLTLKLSSQNKHEKAILDTLNIKNTIISEAKISSNLDSIISSLKEKGYFQTFIDSIHKEKNDFLYFLSLGQKTDSIQLFLPKNEHIHFNTEKETIHISETQNFISNIVKQLDQQGKSFSKVSLKNIRRTKEKLSANLILETTKKRFIDKIVVKGYDRFPKAFLKNYMNLKVGNNISKEKLFEISRHTKSINFVKEVKEPEILFTKDSTTLFLYLKKEKRNNIDGFLNINSDNSLSGNINLELNNILNSGEKLQINWLSNSNSQSNLDFQTNFPFLFNSRFSLDTKFKIRKQDSSFLNSNFKPSILFNLKTTTKIGVSFETESSFSSLNQENEEISNFNSFFWGIRLQTESLHRDRFLNPKLQFHIEWQLGKRKTTINQINQNKLSFDISYLYDINHKNAIFIRNGSAFINSNNLFFNELYTIGGSSTIRGVEQLSIFASSYSFFNIEYRFHASKKSSFYTITDLGTFKNLERKSFNLLGYGIGYSLSNKNFTTNINLTSNINNLTMENGIYLLIKFNNLF